MRAQVRVTSTRAPCGHRFFARHLRGSLALLVGLLATACAGPTTPGSFRLDSDHAIAFEVVAPDRAAPKLTLLGSVHLLDKPISLGPQLARAHRNADALVLEVDLREATEADLAEAMMQHGALGRGEELSDFVSPETIESLDSYLAEQELTEQMVENIHRLRPWTISLFITTAKASEGGLETNYGVEQYFLKHTSTRIPIIGLETIDEQFSSFSFISGVAQEAMLLESIAPTATRGMHQLVEAWKAGDEAALATLTRADMTDEVYQVLFVARNQLMAEGLAELMAEGRASDRYFAVIGAGHLVGDKSVVTMLRERGLRVTRMTSGD